MELPKSAVLWFLLAWTLAAVCNTANGDPISLGLNPNIDSSQGKRSEFFTVHQRTPVVRRRRDAVNHVEFPAFMDFSFRFEDQEVHMTLKRNEYMSANIHLSDQNGPIQHDMGRKTGIYSDVKSKAAFVVQCEDHQDHCTLRGGMARNNTKWHVTPELHTPQLHKAVETKGDRGLFRGNRDSIPPPNPEDLPVTNRTRTPKSWLPTDKDSHRQKRQTIPDCPIVECFAVVDETEWEYFLAKNENDVSAAEAEISVEYLALYTQADLHYDFIPLRRPGACLRIYLQGVTIQKTRDVSWSVSGEVALPGPTTFVNTDFGLFECGADGNAFRTPTFTIDLIQCFTRKDLVYNEGVPNGELFAYHRSVAYDSTCCNTNFLPFSSAVIESYGDKVELLIAHEIGHGLDSQHDSELGCSDDDSYIMSNEVVIREDDLKLRNIWYFSTCSLDRIFPFIEATNPQCLRENSFTAQEYSDFRDAPLAGSVHTWDDQCEVRFGIESEKCDPTGNDREFFDDMCDRGIFCTRPDQGGACTGQGRPYDGTSCGDFDAYCLKGDCFTAPRQLDESCSNNTDCDDPNASCNPTTSTCTCNGGFYDDTGNGGVCIPQVAVGESCLQDDGCLDPNAECSDQDVCICLDGYFVSGQSCELQKTYGEPCMSSVECKGDTIECLGTPPSCRCPTGTYIDDDSGECLTAKVLGEDCEEGQCGPDNSACDTETDTCRCLDGYYDNNGASDAGVCDAKVALAENCNGPDSCSDPNAECDTTCQCLPSFYRNGDTCEPKKPYGEECGDVSECFGGNIECSGTPATCRCPSGTYIDRESGDCINAKVLDEACEEGQCGPENSACDTETNTCRCLDGYYDSNGVSDAGVCNAKEDLGGNCLNADGCLDPNAECNGANQCQCRSGFYADGNTCEQKKPYGEECGDVSECFGGNIECSGTPSTCRCPSGTYIDRESGDCINAKVLDEACEEGQCGPENSACDTETNTCRCLDGYYDNNGASDAGVCNAKEDLGGNCLNADGCLDPNAECNGANQCQCRTGYYADGNTCEQKKPYGEECGDVSECFGGNIECSGTPATCRCPSGTYIDRESGDCINAKVLDEACEEGQCGPDNSACDTETDTCRCLDGYYDNNGASDAGVCDAKEDLGGNCLNADGCLDPNAECNGANQCQCRTGYYADGNTCEQKKPYGEECGDVSECFGGNIECSGTPATCRCPSGTYIDSESGDCINAKVLDEACEEGQCGPENSACDTETNTCRCLDGYYDNNGASDAGVCNAKEDLGGNCLNADGCLDPNAECNGANQCQCRTGYYADGNTCEQKKPYGEECGDVSECFGGNIECSGTPATCRCPSGTYIDRESGDCINAKVLDEACEEGQCGPDNSACDTETDTCRCLDGYYDNNGASDAGVCDAKVALAENCNGPDSCSDPNAECDTTCQCLPSFYRNGDTCEPIKSFGEACSDAGQCFGDGIDCIGTPGTCRCPTGTFIDRQSGNCVTAKDLEESCAPGECGTANAFCDTLIQTCQCQEGFTNDNGVCSASGDFTMRELGETCANTRQCIDTNATCSGALGTCECRDGFYDNDGAPIGGTCEPQVLVGVACPSLPDVCLDENAFCNGSGVCVCKEDYFEKDDGCELLKSIGQECEFAGECRGGNVNCTGAIPTCRCPADRYLDVNTGNCLTDKELGESCEPGQCGPANSCCGSSGTCSCEEGYFADNGACTQKIAVEGSCPGAGSCADPNAVCSTTCTCASGFTNSNGVCVIDSSDNAGGIPAGRVCSDSSECLGGNMECYGTPRTCRCPLNRWFNFNTGNCETRLSIGSPCEIGQCAYNALCDRKKRKCRCEKGSSFNGETCSRCTLPFVEFGDSCYRFGSKELPYHLAKASCDKYDKPGQDCNLVQVDSQDELEFLKEFMSRRVVKPSWGYWNDLFEVSDGVETWRSSGDPPVVTDWDSNEPDDFWGKQSCTMFLRWRSYRQGDVECTNDVRPEEKSNRLGFKLCEFKLDVLDK